MSYVCRVRIAPESRHQEVKAFGVNPTRNVIKMQQLEQNINPPLTKVDPGERAEVPQPEASTFWGP